MNQTNSLISERDKRGINTYGVRGRIGINGTYWKEWFKTKSEAVAYAKSYMKKH